MTSDFYKRTQELLEEFQKRELQFVNTEQLISQRLYEEKNNVSVQDYIQKLNRKEKDTEEIYKGVIKQMGELDQRTESISQKLEKLSLLKSAMITRLSSSSFPAVSFDKSYFNYAQTSITSPNIHNLNPVSNSIQTLITTKQSTNTISTQTDHIFCKNCSLPLSMSNGILNAVPLISSSLNSCIFQPQNINGLECDSSINYSTAEGVVISNNANYQTTISKPTVSNVIVDKNTDLTHIISNEDSSIKSQHQGHDTISNQNQLISSTGIDRFENPAVQDNKAASIGPDAELMQQNINKAEKSSLTENTVSNSDSINRIASKSDDESLNHEFDFLESSKRNKRRLNNEKTRKSFSSETSNKAANFRTDSVINKADSGLSYEIPRDSVPGNILNKSTIVETETKVESKSVNDREDKISESSVSLGGGRGSPSVHSDAMSAVSDSDSLYEKEDPQLKTSAAYQALLGNIPGAKSFQKSVSQSESDTEDEVERALANVTRKSSNIPAVPSQDKNIQDEKKNILEGKTKPEPRKSISVSKPQQLSKSTRKVLGLETSSGSEAELQITPKPSKKIEEDSDEFDFYD